MWSDTSVTVPRYLAQSHLLTDGLLNHFTWNLGTLSNDPSHSLFLILRHIVTPVGRKKFERIKIVRKYLVGIKFFFQFRLSDEPHSMGGGCVV